MNQNRRKRFGEILVAAGLVPESSMAQALQEQKRSGQRLGRVLVEMGLVSEQAVADVLARQFGFKTVRGISGYAFPESLLKLVPSEKALKDQIFPLKVENKTLFLAMADPLDMETLDNLTFQTGLRIVPCVATPSEIRAAIQKHYLREGQGEPPNWWTVVVVEDQELVRGAILAALKKQGYKVIETTNGAEGLAAACQYVPHLIISDTVMPRMDGYELFRALQANPETRHIPVIALSSRSAAEEEARLLEMGYFDFVAKPINPVRLVARVKRAFKTVYGDKVPAPAKKGPASPDSP
jgi:CheY-like chemotaxis protein